MATKKENDTAKNKATVSKSTQPKLIIQDMTLVAPDRTQKDIASLKSAIVRAESIYVPNRVRLYDLYHDVLTLDGHLSGIIDKRIGAVQNKTLKYVDKNNSQVDDFNDLIESEKFNDLIKLIIESKIWGVSGVEFIIGPEFDFEEIPRKHIRPEQGIITTSQYSDTGTSLDDLPYCWMIGKKKDLGKLLQCSMYALYKRAAYGDFAQYVEIFGQPVRIIYYDAYDSKTKADLRKLLTSSGSSLAMMIPKQAKFEMLDGKTSNANGDLQTKMIEACKEEMSVAILGNTETSSSNRNSSGYAQARVHSQQQLEITKTDIRFVQNTLNLPYFINILKSFGYPVSEGGKFVFDKDYDLDQLEKRMKIDQFVSMKVPVGDDYYYDTYGIPKPENYEELKKKMDEMNAAAMNAQRDESDEGDNPDEPEMEDNKAPDIVLKKKTNPIQKLGSFFFKTKREINLSSHYPVLKDLSIDNISDDIYEQIARNLLSDKIAKGDIQNDIYFQNAQKLMDGIGSAYEQSSFNYDDTRNVLHSYFQRNLYKFSAAKSLTEMEQFRDMMTDPSTHELLPLKDFAAKIKASGFQFNAAYLQTEYDTAISKAVSAQKWDAIQAEYLEYRTVGDDRVRPEHAILDGLTYPKNSPIWTHMMPPLDWNCRCTVIPGVEKNYKANNYDSDSKYVGGLVKGTVFDNNPGESRIIYNNNHPYFLNDATGEIKSLKWNNYGLQSIKDTMSSRNLDPALKLQDKDAYESFWKDKANAGQGIVLKSRTGESILFPNYDKIKQGRKNNYFKQHLESRPDPERYKLIANLEDVITDPDEVWSVFKKDKEPVTNHYIKYYEGNPILVLVQDCVGKTMFELTETGFKTRQGILLYKK